MSHYTFLFYTTSTWIMIILVLLWSWLEMGIHSIFFSLVFVANSPLIISTRDKSNPMGIDFLILPLLPSLSPDREQPRRGVVVPQIDALAILASPKLRNRIATLHRPRRMRWVRGYRGSLSERAVRAIAVATVSSEARSGYPSCGATCVGASDFRRV